MRDSSEDKWSNKKKKIRFESEEDLEDLLNEVEKLFEEFEIEIPEELTHYEGEDEDNTKQYIKGYSIIIDSNKKPIIKKFENVDLKDFKKTLIKKRELITDVIDRHDRISIILEIPKVKEENIRIKCYEKSVEIKAYRKIKDEINKPVSNIMYNKKIKLSTKISPRTLVSKYNNGILELNLTKK